MTPEQAYSQMQGTINQMNPLLDGLPGAADYFKKKVGEAYNYNLPVMQNAAQLEGQLYTMPGNLMDQYNKEFGGQTGLSSGARINSILGNIGRQAALSNTAWGLVDNANMRTNDLAKSLTDQYGLQIEALKNKLQPQMSIWDRLYSEQQANKRSAGSGYTGTDWNKIAEMLGKYFNDGQPTPTTPTATAPVIPGVTKQSALNTIYNSGLPAPEKANTGNKALDGYINKFRGIIK